MMKENKEKSKKIPNLLSAVEKVKAPIDRSFLSSLAKQSANEFEACSRKDKQNVRKSSLFFWRTLMRNRIRKIAAIAALIIIIVCLGIFLPSLSTSRKKMRGNELAVYNYKFIGNSEYGRRVRAEKVGKEIAGGQFVTLHDKKLPEVSAAKVVGVESPEVNPARNDRLVVYNAQINLVVGRISEAVEQTRAIAVNLGGYMQEMSNEFITIKVPCDKFQQAILELGKLGEVTRKEIKGTDVTEQMRDLNIRLQNAEQIRERLVKLLDRSGQMEDALKIEKELGRVTETIELLKGKIAHLKNSIDFSTITAYFNSPVPQIDKPISTPFGWIQELGTDIGQSWSGRAKVRKWMWWRKMFEPPEGYIEYYEDKSHNKAMSAEGVMIKVSRHKNYQGGDINFWAGLARRILTEQKVIFVKEQQELSLTNENSCRVLTGTRQIGTKEFGYFLALAASSKNIYVFEAWGPVEKLNQDRAKLHKAVQSLRIR